MDDMMAVYMLYSAEKWYCRGEKLVWAQVNGDTCLRRTVVG